jgi:hypothetical protein
LEEEKRRDPRMLRRKFEKEKKKEKRPLEDLAEGFVQLVVLCTQEHVIKALEEVAPLAKVDVYCSFLLTSSESKEVEKRGKRIEKKEKK